MPRLPQPVPPIFQPEVAADAIVWAATHRRRELYVGWPTVKAIWGLRSPHGHGHAVQDYRYTWLRDAAFVLYASQAIGYHEETFRFFDRLEALFDAAHLQVLRREHDLRLRRLPGAIPWYAKMKQPQ